MDKKWTDKAWDDYQYWIEHDKKILKKINQIIKDIERNGEKEGIGHPEPLSNELSGFYSRHIDDKNRIVYKIENDVLRIIQCGHITGTNKNKKTY